MDEFEVPARRQSGFPPVLAAVFFGTVFGGGLGLQGRGLQALAGDLRGVLDAPALGNPASAAAAPEWTPREAAAQQQSDLERQLTTPWPADRMMVIPEPVAGPAASAQTPALAIRPDWRRHLQPVLDALPAPAQSAAFAAAAALRQAMKDPAASASAAAAARPQPAKAEAAPIHYGWAARGAVLAAAGSSTMNFMGGRVR